MCGLEAIAGDSFIRHSAISREVSSPIRRSPRSTSIRRRSVSTTRLRGARSSVPLRPGPRSKRSQPRSGGDTGR